MDVIQILRITTQYDATEDRIILISEVSGNESINLWLTRRFMNRIVPHLTIWLENDIDSKLSETLLEFQQIEAKQILKNQAAVRRTNEQSTLLRTVDITTNNEQLELTFKLESYQYKIQFTRLSLHQWLSIIIKTYKLAEWPIDIWPKWFKNTLDEEKPKIVH